MENYHILNLTVYLVVYNVDTTDNMMYSFNATKFLNFGLNVDVFEVNGIIKTTVSNRENIKTFGTGFLLVFAAVHTTTILPFCKQ